MLPRALDIFCPSSPRINPWLTSLWKGSAVETWPRSKSTWEGRSKTSAVREYGHLPGAVWVDQTEALTADGRLKPDPELNRLFAKAGVRDRAQAVRYAYEHGLAS